MACMERNEFKPMSHQNWCITDGVVKKNPHRGGHHIAHERLAHATTTPLLPPPQAACETPLPSYARATRCLVGTAGDHNVCGMNCEESMGWGLQRKRACVALGGLALALFLRPRRATSALTEQTILLTNYDNNSNNINSNNNSSDNGIVIAVVMV